ncbi:MAG: hypothetical protein LC650_02545 [Actinobacteria bacterium]|nr:hypothetical protein [Actinomycetota bacterium]
MRVVKCKVSHNFLTELLRDEIDLEHTELPSDVKVWAVKGNIKEQWFYLYLHSREYVDIDLEYDRVPEMTLWFGHRRKDAKA